MVKYIKFKKENQIIFIYQKYNQILLVKMVNKLIIVKV